ncbi:MAG TPA: hypothetical protein VEJ63_08345 [Planctomycetota bacterium]|nr:hypothetical protein [Planctomycetota bacterium]
MDEKSSKNIALMAFGLPIMTTAIVLGSMYAGHLITTRSDRPTNVNVAAPTPRIDVNVPQAAPPTVAVNATAPKVDVHVPQAAPAAVTVNPPSMPAPHITVNPPPASVTVIKEEKHERYAERVMERPVAQTVAAVAPASNADIKPAVAAPAPAAPVKAPEVKPVEPAKTEPNKSSSINVPTVGPSVTASAPVAEPAKAEAPKDIAEPTLDTLYTYASKYVDSYCRKKGLDPDAEAKKWNRNWKANVEQSISDNIDSGEQSYINRVVIAKRDHFTLENASPEKVVEACRILLRYRDGQLAWLQAMQDAMTKENLRKTVAFLAAGPR